LASPLAAFFNDYFYRILRIPGSIRLLQNDWQNTNPLSLRAAGGFPAAWQSPE